jgi:hypothetical protein
VGDLKAEIASVKECTARKLSAADSKRAKAEV